MKWHQTAGPEAPRFSESPEFPEKRKKRDLVNERCGYSDQTLIGLRCHATHDGVHLTKDPSWGKAK
jgi:hypothetical protein